ncbi:AzlC family ABC transporter permease [Streptomyces afghaniensis]|uniref:AzlC family ABC transporter permease n=1 Tax=Streptomyces afghaniensis TaxID=66865 RepID=UPI003794492D
MLPLGPAFGALVVQSGLDWWWAGLSAALIYGGSFEFLLIGMVTAAAPLASIAVAAFLVQARHVFYAPGRASASCGSSSSCTCTGPAARPQEPCSAPSSRTVSPDWTSP